MTRLVSAWNSFARNGKPVIPDFDIDWPLYKAESSKLTYLRPGNYTIARDPSRNSCELWRPFLLKKGNSTTPSPQISSVSKTGQTKTPQNPQISNSLKPQEKV
ncbi:acetylcholinesterase-1-like [Ixodes scapularis]